MPRFASPLAFVWPKPVISVTGSRWAADVSEMRVDVGPGYRLYFTRRASILIVMLAGGDKSS